MSGELRHIYDNLYSENVSLLDNDITSIEITKSPNNENYENFDKKAKYTNILMQGYFVDRSNYVTMNKIINNKSINGYIEEFSDKESNYLTQFLNNSDNSNYDVNYNDIKIDTVYIYPGYIWKNNYIAKFDINPTCITIGNILYLNQLAYQMTRTEEESKNYEHCCITGLKYYYDNNALHIQCCIST